MSSNDPWAKHKAREAESASAEPAQAAAPSAAETPATEAPVSETAVSESAQPESARPESAQPERATQDPAAEETSAPHAADPEQPRATLSVSGQVRTKPSGLWQGKDKQSQTKQSQTKQSQAKQSRPRQAGTDKPRPKQPAPSRSLPISDQLNPLTCPKCHQPLEAAGRNWRCADGHSYDTAKQGYVNLLLVDQKKSKQPGDDMDMVRARADFLDDGYYQPIADALNAMITGQLGDASDQTLLDIGCGDGWYTARMAEQIPALGQITGLDISRDAVRYATRRSKNIRWIVASGARPPLLPHSQNAIVTLFTPLMPQGLEHALAADGFIITASTGLSHLSELRERIYTDVREEFWSPVSQMQEAGFVCVAEQTVNFRFRPADSDTLIDLLNMTPHRWKVAPQTVAALRAQDTFDMEADITLHCFRRSEGHG